MTKLDPSTYSGTEERFQMSFSKADQLLALANMVAASRVGILLDDVESRFGVSHRTAQRMMRALEMQFPDVETRQDAEGRKRWRLQGGHLRDLMTLEAEELAALDLAISKFSGDGNVIERKALIALRDKIMTLVPRSKALRLETDHEAILEAQGFVARPGPRPRIDEEIVRAIGDGIKACQWLDINYKSYKDAEHRTRRVAPLGLLSGVRVYLIAQVQNGDERVIRTFRLDAISQAIVLNEGFERPEDFDVHAFAAQSFGVFQNDSDFTDVIWRFKPEAAEQARGYLFHPHQTVEEQPDGSIIVRFRASGQLEMSWHLYTWGDKVEVLAPETLKALVHPFRRNDFPAMP
jgi:predicted DNA-binding transcriptional regulator YafY